MEYLKQAAVVAAMVLASATQVEAQTVRTFASSGVRTHADELTGSVSHYTVSGPMTRPTRPMRSPYDDVSASVYLVCSPGDDPYVGLAFTTAPNLVDDESRTGSAHRATE